MILNQIAVEEHMKIETELEENMQRENRIFIGETKEIDIMKSWENSQNGKKT